PVATATAAALWPGTFPVTAGRDFALTLEALVVVPWNAIRVVPSPVFPAAPANHPAAVAFAAGAGLAVAFPFAGHAVPPLAPAAAHFPARVCAFSVPLGAAFFVVPVPPPPLAPPTRPAPAPPAAGAALAVAFPLAGPAVPPLTGVAVALAVTVAGAVSLAAL